MNGTKTRGFTLVETLVGLAASSILALMLFAAATPLAKTAARSLAGMDADKQGLVLAKTLKSDLLFMLRDADKSGFRANGQGFSFLSMQRPDASFDQGVCMKVSYESGRDGLFRVARPADGSGVGTRVLMLAGPHKLSYLAGDGWRDDWTRDKERPLMIRVLSPRKDTGRDEFLAALP